jgi:hypothetical protein
MVVFQEKPRRTVAGPEAAALEAASTLSHRPCWSRGAAGIAQLHGEYMRFRYRNGHNLFQKKGPAEAGLGVSNDRVCSDAFYAR